MIGHGCAPFSYNLNKADFNIKKSYVKPKAIYSGSLAGWVDFDLLIKAVATLQEVDFIFIGATHATTPKQKLKQLQQFSNAEFVGYVNFGELPDYYKTAQLGLVPYSSNNEHIYYSTPTKFLDYFSAGLAVISTDFPGARIFKEQIFIAKTHDQFVDGIRTTLSQDNLQKAQERIGIAKERTWPKQIEKMTEKLK